MKKSFQEYAFEQATIKMFNEVGSMLGQMGSAFVGGALQHARGQGFNLGAAIQDPWQDSIAQNVFNGDQNSFDLSKNMQYKKFLTGQDERTRAVLQWMNNSQNFNSQMLYQHYNGDSDRWGQDFQNAIQNWIADSSKSPTGLGQYLMQQLKLPLGSLN